MQKHISLLPTETHGTSRRGKGAAPVRRLILRGNRDYLRALRAAEMAAWEHGIPLLQPARRVSGAGSTRSAHDHREARQTAPAKSELEMNPLGWGIRQ